jgi:outer membrane protein assembly factor BamB
MEGWYCQKFLFNLLSKLFNIRNMYKIRYVSIVFLLFPIWLSGQDIAQWRGPERSGVYPETGLLDGWPEEGPEQLWSTEGIGKGFSSVSVLDGTIYATGLNDSVESLTAINRADGQILWQIPYGQSILRSFKDTRCTPTIEEGRAYMISGRGEVVCVDLAEQQIVWNVNAFHQFEGESARWEIAESPLLVDDKVIYTPGGHKTTMVALDKQTGETIWTSETLNDTSAFVSPILIERGDKKIIVNVLSNYLIGVNAENGEIFWSYKYSELENPLRKNSATFINTISPLYKSGRLFITSGYDHTSAMFELSGDGTEISLVWSQPVLDTHHGGVVLYDGYLYGSTWINNREGNWACVEWETGELMYEQEWNNKGSIISADDKLFVYEEKSGFVGLVKPGPEDFQVISSFKHDQGSGPHWAHPSINDGVLYVRHGDTITAYKISN